MKVQVKPRIQRPTTDGRNWCRLCGGINACLSWCPTKTGKRAARS